ncbi:MAG TPA: hypothetical protein VG478_00510 [Acidimicrobiales bacterium]|jgi:hypothetical protein|nr:hypothetical protein [Acidimicrobiales bacterium]
MDYPHCDHPKHKAALTRAEHSGDPLKVLAACRDFAAWAEREGWPDDWHRWQRAMRDALGTLHRQLDALHV